MLAIRRVLAPTDFSDRAAGAVRYAAEFAEKFGAELVLLHVVQDLGLVLPDAVMPTPMPAADLTQLIDSGRAGLDNLTKDLDIARLNPKREVRVGSPAGEIVTAAADLKADLICIGTHGRTGLAHLLLGSVAEKIVRESPCPVLTVRHVEKAQA